MADEKQLLFQQDLETFLGSSEVYFQPPESVQMKYPCIIYFRKSSYDIYADNKNYMFFQGYDVRIIDKNPVSGLVTKFAQSIPCSKYDRQYVFDGLYHDCFVVYR